MSDKEEICALRKRIDRVLNAIPLLRQRLAQQRDQAPATSKRTRRKRAGLPPGMIQLSLFAAQDGDQAQDQAG